MLVIVSTEAEAFPNVHPRPPINSKYSTSHGVSLKKALLYVFFLTSAYFIVESVITGKRQSDLLRKYTRYNSTSGESIVDYEGYEQEMSDNEREIAIHNANLDIEEFDSRDESPESTVVFNTTYNIGRPNLKPKHETLTISETPSQDIHNCIDGVCSPRHVKADKDLNCDVPQGNSNGAGEHIMPKFKPDAEKLPSEIAAEYVNKAKEYVKQLKTAKPREFYQIRRKYEQSRRQMKKQFNREQEPGKEEVFAPPERL
uniref:Uncharacterized protein n=1 Tax=Plectus sambesii TaxID=2011161 RepID=A0A914UP06_9BILA